MRTLGGVLAIVCAAAVAGAAEWDTISPGVTTMEGVRAQFGAPTRTERQKTEGYDTAAWTYENAQAPTGMSRVVVDFGLLTAQGFRADLVRSMRIEPKPGVFNRVAVVNAWGEPSRAARESEGEVFFYAEGLLVYFDKDGESARLMVFTPPQPLPPPEPAPR